MQPTYRIAPSPTGYLHLGHAKLFLINYALAQNSNGKLIYRVEDTDLKRNSEEAIGFLLDEIEWFGVKLDGGPERKGKNEYFQTTRFPIYKEHVEKLLAEGKAYKAYETPEERAKQIEDQRKKGELPIYSGAHRNLTPEQIKIFGSEGRKPMIRLKVEPNRIVTYHDEVLGEISFNTNTIGDIAIMKSDGSPMYNFAAAIDDHLMGITDVVRGREHISNTPKQILIYNAFGWELPRFAHWSALLNENAPGKLSKRKGAKSLILYRAEGYLPDAILNYLIVVSFSFHFQSKDDEIITREEIINNVRVDKILRTNSKFNAQKLDWFNGQHIRRLTPEDFEIKIKTWLEKEIRPINIFSPEFDIKIADKFLENFELIKKALPHVQTRISKYIEIFDLLKFLIERPQKSHVDMSPANHQGEELENAIDQLYHIFSKMEEGISHSEWETSIRSTADQLEWKHGDLFMLLRLIVVGSRFSPPLFEMIALLGKSEIEERFKAFL